MLTEMLAALMTVIDLMLKKKDYREKVDLDLLAKNLISLLIELERIEHNADKIRWYFFYLERDADDPAQVEKHKNHLRQFIPTQIDALYDLNERYSKFRPMFEVYMENNSLPRRVASHVFAAKQLYLYDIVSSLDRDTDDFAFARSEYAIENLKAIHAFKEQVSSIIRQHIPLINFAKWYEKPKEDYLRNEIERAREMRERK